MKPYVRDSEEFFEFTLTDRRGNDITGDAVQCAIEQPGVADPTWIDCEWIEGDTWRTTVPIVWSAANYPKTTSRYQGWARVVDSPETPWASLGAVPIQER